MLGVFLVLTKKRGYTMPFDTQIINHTNINLSVSLDQIVDAVKNMDKEEQEDFIEDLLAAISPEYLESIREARQDYKEGRVYSHEEVFG